MERIEFLSQNPVIISDMKTKVDDILVSISWREIARKYFGKSSSWLYHKMNGIDGNGGVGGFSPEEAVKMRDALRHLADRINACADKI